MNFGQPKEIFSNLFKLCDKYGSNMIIYCQTEPSNKIACDMSEKSTLSDDDKKIMKSIIDVLGKNHFDKLNKLKLLYDGYKLNGKGTIKFAYSDGKIFYASIADLINPSREILPITSNNVSDKKSISQNIQSNEKIPIGTTSLSDSDDSVSFMETSSFENFDLSGGKSKKVKRAKKEKRKAKKKYKKNPEAKRAKLAKQKSKLAKKTLSSTPEGQKAKQTKKKVKELKRQNASKEEIALAKKDAKKAKHDALNTQEGKSYKSTRKQAKEQKKIAKSTQEGHALRDARRNLQQIISDEPVLTQQNNDISVSDILQEGISRVKQGVSKSREQIENVVNNGIPDNNMDISLILEKMLYQSKKHTELLNELVGESSRNDEKLTKILETMSTHNIPNISATSPLEQPNDF